MPAAKGEYVFPADFLSVVEGGDIIPAPSMPESLRLPTSPMIAEALKERPPSDIAVVWCDHCAKIVYCSQGSHCYCEHCGANLDHLIDPDTGDVTTLDDAWDAAIESDERGYP